MSDETDPCIHIPRPREEHDRLHKTPKDSCGWCCYLKAEGEAKKMRSVLERIAGAGEMTGGYNCAEWAAEALRSEQAKDDG